MSTARVEAAIDALRKGEMIVVTDDEDRENEGDLIMAASLAQPSQIAFIIRHTSGILCAPLPSDYAKKFDLSPMVIDNSAPLSTPFTISIDYAHGLTTGISAEERCSTVRALANNNASANDFVRPGHIFPLRANDGGVLMRAGHTEAAVDLVRMAGLPPVGVLAELVNDDGTVKCGQDVLDFAKDNNLVLVSIDELIAYRQQREKLVERQQQFERDLGPGRAQIFTYKTVFDDVEHLAIMFGDPQKADFVPTRIHRESTISDVFGENRPLDVVRPYLEQHGCALFLYLRAGGVGVITDSIRDQIQSLSKGEGKESEQQRQAVWKELGLGAHILRDLGATHIELISSTPRKYAGLEGFGIKLKD